MPQTLTSWILVTAVLLAGASGGYMAAQLITTARGGNSIDRRDVVVIFELIGIMIASGVLLLLTEGH